MKLRRLNKIGIERFSTYLSGLRNDGKLEPPFWILEGDESSEPVADVDVPLQDFENRLEVAEFLSKLIEKAELIRVDSDPGLWSWLTLYYFNQVCPVKKGKGRSPFKEEFRYIPAQKNFQKYYRHLLFGPYVIFQAHRDWINKAMALLIGPIHTSNDIIEQIASRLEYVSNPDVVETATELYLEPETQEYKYGARGSGNGSPRRLTTILQQFEMTYDLSGMSKDSIIALLPKEFDRFRK